MKHNNSDSEKVDHLCGPQQPKVNRLAPRRRLLILSLIFLTALGVRLLNWHGSRKEVSAVQTSVVLNYQQQARLIRENGLASLYDASSSTSNPDLLGHPLGYPILLSLIHRIAPESDTATQLVQMMLDSLAAVIICLIAFELFPTAVGVISGLMAAFAPQFSWNSILLLPDSLAALPILLAVLLIACSCSSLRVRSLAFPAGSEPTPFCLRLLSPCCFQSSTNAANDCVRLWCLLVRRAW